ncbi:MAG: hypothetical protein ACRDN1_15880 [Trebonia sp.]
MGLEAGLGEALRTGYFLLREEFTPVHGAIADVVVVWARDTADRQVKGFLVEWGTPGFTARLIEGKARCARCGKPRSAERGARSRDAPSSASPWSASSSSRTAS